jgi:soluble lytic murein transglycosylase
MGLSKWQPALDDYRAYLQRRPGLIDSYVEARSGDALLALGQIADALADYQQAASASRTADGQMALQERMAQIDLQNGQVDQAVAAWDAVLAETQDAATSARIQLKAAQAQLQAGQTDAALVRMQRIFDQYSHQPEAYTAMLALLDAGKELDLLDQARVRFDHGDYRDVLKLLNTYTTQTEVPAIPSEVQMLLGRSYREIGSFDAANVAFQTIVTQYPNDSQFGAALLEQAQTKLTAGDTDGAIAQYVYVADNYGYLPEAATALLRAGTLEAQNGNATGARTLISRLADKYPKTQAAHDGLKLAATLAFAAGDQSSAELYYGQLAVASTGEDQAAAYFMAGRMALQRGDTRTAQQSLDRVAAAAPDSYYAARAQEVINNREPFQPPKTVTLQRDETADRDAAEAWMRSTFGLTQTGPLWPTAQALDSDPRMIRGRELWTLAAYQEAQSEFADLINSYRDDPLASYQLATALRDLTDYSDSIVAVANVIRKGNVGTLDAPVYLSRMRYPVYYADVISKIADQQKIDPLLLFAIIRNESLFDTHATGAANERGLMQVIPSTAETVNIALQWPNYQHTLLYRPSVGVTFGATYFADMLAQFNGSVIAALAGYNAGPRLAKGWLTLSGGDPDLYIGSIDVDHTRDYVERVYSYYSVYRALYGSEQRPG